MPEISDEQRDATLANLRAMNAELETEIQMRRDAERYRFIRREDADLGSEVLLAYLPSGEDLDALIDAAIAAEQ